MEIVILLLLLVVAAGPGIFALVVMNRSGRGWAQARMIGYPICGAVYGLNAALLIADGVAGGAWISIVICFVAVRGAYRAWQAWRVGDYRPAKDRERDAKMTGREMAA
jgi:hypothetical protein